MSDTGQRALPPTHTGKEAHATGVTSATPCAQPRRPPGCPPCPRVCPAGRGVFSTMAPMTCSWGNVLHFCFFLKKKISVKNTKSEGLF